MEVLPVGSKHNITKLSNEDLSFTIGLETVQPSDFVHNLGVWLDSELSLRQHVTKIAAICFYQLRRLRQVRRRAGREITTRPGWYLHWSSPSWTIVTHSLLACRPQH